MTMVAVVPRAQRDASASGRAADVPHDLRLPQLGTVLDAAAMRDVLAATTGWPIADCRIDRVRYRPGHGCLVSYRLIRTASDGTAIEERLAARAWPLAEATRRFAKAAAIDPGVLHVVPLGLVVWRWPSDRKLAHLAAFADPDVLRSDVLPRLVAAHWRGAARLVDAAVDVVRHVPEQGCTVRADLTVDLGIGVRTRVVWYGKTLAAGRAENTWATLRAITAAGVTAPGPVALDVATGSVWVAEVGGRTLADRLATDTVPDAEWGRLGRAVARLHTVSVGACTTGTIDDAASLARASTTLRAALPHLASRLDGLVPRIQAALASDASRVLLHGDLHPGNVLLDGRRTTLIDFDAAVGGRRTADLGSFIAALRVQALHAGIEANDARARPTRDAVGRFVAAYERAAGATIDRALLDAATAHALVTERAYRAVTRMKPGRRATVDAIVALAESLVAETARV
jgi:aminoglycoside phosphotransferase (APT) family kinase protein